jgi:hypothetical protein
MLVGETKDASGVMPLTPPIRASEGKIEKTMRNQICSVAQPGDNLCKSYHKLCILFYGALRRRRFRYGPFRQAHPIELEAQKSCRTENLEGVNNDQLCLECFHG